MKSCACVLSLENILDVDEWFWVLSSWGGVLVGGLNLCPAGQGHCATRKPCFVMWLLVLEKHWTVSVAFCKTHYWRRTLKLHYFFKSIIYWWLGGKQRNDLKNKAHNLNYFIPLTDFNSEPFRMCLLVFFLHNTFFSRWWYDNYFLDQRSSEE